MRFKRRSTHCPLPTAHCLLLMLLAGCGSGRPETAAVAGKISYQGKAVTAGKIMFYPESGRPAVGTIQADGSYQLTTFDEGDGAVLGKHQVTITASRTTGGPAQPKTFEEELALAGKKSAPLSGQPVVTWLVPEEYSQRHTSPVTADVVRGENTIDFRLPQP